MTRPGFGKQSSPAVLLIWLCLALIHFVPVSRSHLLADDEEVLTAVAAEEALSADDVVGEDEEMEVQEVKQDAVVLIAQAPVAAPVKAGALPGQPAAAGAQPDATATGGNPAQPNPAAASVTVTNIEDKEFKAPQVEFQNGKVTVKSDPPQSISLEELQKVAFTHETKLSAIWGGQTARDLVGVGAVSEGNSIRDLHIHAAGLTAKKLTQVAIVARPQFRVWKLDVSKSLFWKLSVERIGEASVADFYFEPPTKDLFETELELTVTFDDKSTAKTTLKVTDHTSDQATVDADPAAASAAPRLATLQLEGNDKLKGRILQGDAENCVLETAWKPSFEIPLLEIRGILFDEVKPEVKKKFDEQIAKPGDDDFVMVVSKDGGFAELNVRIQAIGDSGLKMIYEEQQRTVKLERVQAVVFGTHPATRAWKGPYQIFKLASGDLVSGYWQTYVEKTVQVKTPWGTELEFPREAVVEVTGRNTKMVNLSELTPTAVEQVPYFDRLLPWVRDKAWNNRPLKMNERTYQRGLAMHSRCVLTYDLAGEFATFRAVLGFEDDIGERGRVDCKVTVDEQELFAKTDLRATEKPVPVEVSVKGAKQLRLEVDFGQDEDVGDRVIWANARLYRE